MAHYRSHGKFCCSVGRMPGTVKKGNLWLVQVDAE